MVYYIFVTSQIIIFNHAEAPDLIFDSLCQSRRPGGPSVAILVSEILDLVLAKDFGIRLSIWYCSVCHVVSKKI